MREKVEIYKKVPRCVGVYNRLFEMIKAKEFGDSGKLPAEPGLAKMMGVSRTTLRQALDLLEEDGLVKCMQGKGNFIIKSEVKKKSGLEILSNPISCSLIDEITEIEIDFRIEAGNEYTAQIMERNVAIVVFVDRWFKSGDKVIGYSISVIPAETILASDIDLNNKERLLNYLETEVYSTAKYSAIKVGFSEIGNISSVKYDLGKDNKCHLLSETLYGKQNVPIVFTKHYIPLEEANIVIYRTLKQEREREPEKE